MLMLYAEMGDMVNCQFLQGQKTFSISQLSVNLLALPPLGQ